MEIKVTTGIHINNWLFAQKLAYYEYLEDCINLVFATQKYKLYCNESDAILLLITDKIGFGK